VLDEGKKIQPRMHTDARRWSRANAPLVPTRRLDQGIASGKPMNIRVNLRASAVEISFLASISRDTD
jgi:hypothetical protein